MQALHVGASQVIITPPIGTAMAGYVQRTAVSEGITDDLCAQALFLQHGHVSLLLLSLDVLHVDEEFGACIAEALGLPPANVIVSATHTHSGPHVMHSHDALRTSDGGHSAVLRALWINQAVGASRWAMRTSRPVSVAGGITQVSDVGGNRNDPDTPVDQSLSVVSFLDRQSDKPLATIVNYACHPTILGAPHLSFSTDFVGPLRHARGNGPTSYVASPEKPVVLFLNGAAGDVSTRFHRRSQSVAEAVRLGRMVAQAADIPLDTLGAGGARRTGAFAAALQQITLKARVIPSAQDAHRVTQDAEEAYKEALAEGHDAATLRIRRTRFEGALRQERLSIDSNRRHAPPPLTVRLWVLGSLALVAVPAELFSSLGWRIKQNPLATLTLIAGYSNGYVGYIPDTAGYSGGSYEALSTIYERGEGEALCDRIRVGLERVSPPVTS